MEASALPEAVREPDREEEVDLPVDCVTLLLLVWDCVTLVLLVWDCLMLLLLVWDCLMLLLLDRDCLTLVLLDRDWPPLLLRLPEAVLLVLLEAVAQALPVAELLWLQEAEEGAVWLCAELGELLP